MGMSEDMLKRMRRFRKLSAIGKKCLHLVARSLDQKEVAVMTRHFMELDANGDGVLTLEEMEIGLEAAGVEFKELQALFEEADDDHSGSIDYTEFLTMMMNRKLLMDKQACWEAFRVLDADGTRTVDREEIKNYIEGSGGVMTEELEEAIAKADADQDGSVDFEEFCSLIRKTLSPIDQQKEEFSGGSGECQTREPAKSFE